MDRTPCVELLNENSPSYTNIVDSDIKLKHHQLVSLQKCITLENEGVVLPNNYKYTKIVSNIGILADNVGSGKSYIILALLVTNPRPLITKNMIQSYGNYNITIEYATQEYKYIDVNIIVCSYGLINQWEKYIKLFYDAQASYYIINSKKKYFEFVQSKNAYTILLVSSSFYKYLVNHILTNKYIINRLIFDEADNIASTPRSEIVPSTFYWFVTASYYNILFPYPKYDYSNYTNSYMVSQGISNTYIRYFIGHIIKTLPQAEQFILDKTIVKCDDDFIKKSFMIPNNIIKIIQCQDPFEISILSNIAHHNIIKLLNAGDVQGAISLMDRKNVGSECNIIKIAKYDFNKQLKNVQTMKKYHNDIIYDNENDRIEKIDECEKRETLLIKKLDLLEKRITESNSCHICLSDSIENKAITSCCRNTFCFECVCKWISQAHTCPLCKKSLSKINQDLYICKNDLNGVSNKETIYKPKTKIESLKILLNQLKKNDLMKVLIFSEYDNTFVVIENILRELNIKYGFLKGNCLKNTLDKYKRSKNINVLLVNSRSYGSGLNLENTTDVILFHKFDGQIENQVIGRAQRPGRTTPLNVWYLLHENENNM